MRKNKRKITQKKILKQTIICLTTVFLIAILNIVVFKNNLITPKIDKVTTSYVSLYNQDSTDMLKITNIKKLSQKKGLSNSNDSNISISITSTEKTDYEVILYEIQNNIPEEYIKLAISTDKKTKINTLDKIPKNEDGGRSIYTGKTGKDNIKIKMWVSDKYNEKINDTSFEIRVKKR